MIVRYIVFAVYTFASLCTGDSCIETLTILLLTLRFFTYASWTCFSWTFTFYLSFGLFNQLRMFMCVTTSKTCTLWSTLFTRWKTFAIVFQAMCFSTCTTRFFSFDFRSLNHRFCWNGDIESEWVFFLGDLFGFMAL